MPQYPNYSMNNYPQFVQQQPYQNGYPQMQAQNPYMDRLSQFQSMQVPQQSPVQTIYQSLTGRIVDDFNVISANDVPMDGNGSFFIKSDGSEIQHRNWTAQGTIATRRFKPILNEKADNVLDEQEKLNLQVVNEATMVFDNYFQKINERFDVIEKALKASGNRKKEVTSDRRWSNV